MAVSLSTFYRRLERINASLKVDSPLIEKKVKHVALFKFFFLFLTFLKTLRDACGAQKCTMDALIHCLSFSLGE